MLKERSLVLLLYISAPSKQAEGVFKQQDTHSANKPH